LRNRVVGQVDSQKSLIRTGHEHIRSVADQLVPFATDADFPNFRGTLDVPTMQLVVSTNGNNLLIVSKN
jgi:hypothetical protein